MHVMLYLMVKKRFDQSDVSNNNKLFPLGNELTVHHTALRNLIYYPLLCVHMCNFDHSLRHKTDMKLNELGIRKYVTAR